MRHARDEFAERRHFLRLDQPRLRLLQLLEGLRFELDLEVLEAGGALLAEHFLFELLERALVLECLLEIAARRVRSGEAFMGAVDLGLGLGLLCELQSSRERRCGFFGVAPLDKEGPEIEQARDLGGLVPEGPTDLESLGQVVFRFVELSLGEVDGSNIVERARFGQPMAGFTAQLEAFEMVLECLIQHVRAVRPSLSLVHGSKPSERSTHTEPPSSLPRNSSRARV